jgi:hypothetical protein
VDALVAGTARQIILDGPGVDALGGEVVTTEPSALIQASHAVAVGNALVLDGADLPAYMSHLAGTYSVAIPTMTNPNDPDAVSEATLVFTKQTSTLEVPIPTTGI